jgi:hypothetical protein
VAWVDSGWWCGARVAAFLKSVADRLVLLNLDDPTGPREPHHWRSLVRAAAMFDLCALVRSESKREFEQLGSPNVLQIWRGYDEIAQAPEQADVVPAGQLESEVAFIGTRMEDRHKFLLELIDRRVPLSIWGGNWQRGPGWSKLRPYWRGPALINAEYVAGIRRAKVCLGLLSRLNRDLHTTRSAEIPYAGGLLCAQRTAEHLAMYDDGREAVFWDDAEECAEACHRLLGDAALRERIRAAGAAKVRRLGIGNEQLVTNVLDALFESQAAQSESAAATIS